MLCPRKRKRYCRPDSFEIVSLAGNTGHYDGVIAAFESLDIQVIPCFSMGLDARPAIEKFLYSGEEKKIDALVSLTGFHWWGACIQ